MQPVDILQQNHLRQTRCRTEVLAAFLNSHQALAHADLENALPGHDRVTLYRTLNTFLEQEIIHKVLDDSAIIKYALTHRHDSHVHFKCEVCNTTICLDAEVPKITVPQKFKVNHQELLVLGVCANCN